MTIGVGIIGLGMATKPHMTSLRELEAAGRAKIVGGFAPSPERRRACTSCWKTPKPKLCSRPGKRRLAP
jgi:predicted dehydrogenase